MNDDENIILFRGEGINIEQMCAALPKIFCMTDNQAVTVLPYPIFSDRNKYGQNILVLCDAETEAMTVIDYDELMKMEFVQ